MRDIRTSPWLQTYTGLVVDLLDPKPEQIVIEDIAHSLANCCRFGGHTKEFYSIAQHSVLVASILSDELDWLELWGLMHDASEAYIIDIPRPLKYYLDGKYAALERLYMEVICKKFGLPIEEPIKVKVADQIALITERRDLLAEQEVEWDIKADPLPKRIRPLSPWFAEHRFLGVFRMLYQEVA